MKLHFDVKTLAGETVSLSLAVSSQETVQSVKERIVSAEPNPFPEQALLLEGKKLSDYAKMSECGLEDGGRLTFQAHASEDALAKQLQDMLRANGPVALEELGFMYSLKYGVTIGQALQALGKNDLLKVFLERMGKHFLTEGGKVQAAPLKTTAAPAAAQLAVSATQLLTVTVLVTLHLPSTTRDPEERKLSVKAGETVRQVKERVAAMVQLPFEGQVLLLRGKPLRDEACLAEAGIADGACLQLEATASEAALVGQLVALLGARGPMSRVELDDSFCLRHGMSATQALGLLGWGEKFQHFLGRKPDFVLQRGCVALSQTPPTAPPGNTSGNKAYLDLHAKLCGGGFSGRLERALEDLADCLRKETFLNVAHVVKGGAAATGTSIPGAVGAELVLFVEGLPPTGQDVWLPGLATSVAKGLSERLIGQQGIQEIREEGNSLCLSTDGPLGDVRVFLSPAYADYQESHEALRQQGPEAQAAGACAFAEQRARFMQRQSGGVKATLRLLKWWRQQQQWSSDTSRPSDELLELVVAHAAAQRVPRDLQDAVDTALWSLAKFDELRIVWPLASRSYREGDVPPLLLEQQPLVADPANPFANVADPALFQPKELVERARSGIFF